MSAIGALVSVILFLAGVIGYLWKEYRAESRARAKDSALFLHTLETSRSKYSARVPGPDRRTPSDNPPSLEPSLTGFYSKILPRRNPTRG
jgi:hypothetical protein